MDTKVSLYHSRKAGTLRESWTQKPPSTVPDPGRICQDSFLQTDWVAFGPSVGSRPESSGERRS